MLSEDLRLIGPRDPSADLEVVFSDLRSENSTEEDMPRVPRAWYFRIGNDRRMMQRSTTFFGEPRDHRHLAAQFKRKF